MLSFLCIIEIIKYTLSVENRGMMKETFLEKKFIWCVTMLMFRNSDSDLKGHGLDKIKSTWWRG